MPLALSRFVPSSKGNVGQVLNGTYGILLPAIAGCAATLTGLLFVAISLADRNARADRPVVVREVRAAVSILAFTNALTVSLFGLVPGNNIGWPATVVAVIGIFFTAAGARSIFASHLPLRHVPRQLALIAALLATFAFELVAGIELLGNPRNSNAAATLGDLLIILLIIGITRAWELVSSRDTGIFTSIAVLAGHEGDPNDLAGTEDSGAELRAATGA